jgi:hypothetical protein
MEKAKRRQTVKIAFGIIRRKLPGMRKGRQNKLARKAASKVEKSFELPCDSHKGRDHLFNSSAYLWDLYACGYDVAHHNVRHAVDRVLREEGIA